MTEDFFKEIEAVMKKHRVPAGFIVARNTLLGVFVMRAWSLEPRDIVWQCEWLKVQQVAEAGALVGAVK